MLNKIRSGISLIMLVKTITICFIALGIISCKAETQTADQPLTSTDTKPTPTNHAKNEGLDLLSNYDRDLWDGPDGWTDEQWRWKRLLRWDKNCDYVASIDIHTISDTQELIQVMCVPGSYQATYYLFLFNKEGQTSTQLALGAPENTDNPYEISGHLSYDKKASQLSITSLSRGVGDCGVYQLFSFTSTNGSTLAADEPPTLIEKRQRSCSETIPKTESKTIFDPTQWPLSTLANTH